MTEHKRIESGAIVETLPSLPARITLFTGQTINGFNTLPAVVHKALGYLPVIRDAFDAQTHIAQAIPDITEDAVIYHAEPRDIDELKMFAKQQIDISAGETRSRFIPPGNMQDQEYKLAQREAIEFKAAGYPVDDVPPSISVSAMPRGNTDQQECDAILMEAAQLEGLLVAIRQIRLVAKAAIDAVIDDNALVVTVRDSAIAELNEL